MSDHYILDSGSRSGSADAACGRCGKTWGAAAHVEHGCAEILDPECPDCGWPDLDDEPSLEEHFLWLIQLIEKKKPSEKVCLKLSSWYGAEAKTSDELIGAYLAFAREYQDEDGWGFDWLGEDARVIYDG